MLIIDDAMSRMNESIDEGMYNAIWYFYSTLILKSYNLKKSYKTELTFQSENLFFN